jgi:hypothetical protein
VPSVVVVLEQLPLTPNGKVDVAALPPPQRIRQGQFLAPRNNLEKTVADVWKNVLSLSGVGVHDNFFELGGTSLLLYRVYSRLSEIRSDLRVVDLFRYSTVEELAGYLGAGAARDPSDLAGSRTRAGQRRAARELLRP